MIVAPVAGAAKRARDLMLRLASVNAGIALGEKVRPTHDETSEVTALRTATIRPSEPGQASRLRASAVQPTRYDSTRSTGTSTRRRH